MSYSGPTGNIGQILSEIESILALSDILNKLKTVDWHKHLLKKVVLPV